MATPRTRADGVDAVRIQVCCDAAALALTCCRALHVCDYLQWFEEVRRNNCVYHVAERFEEEKIELAAVLACGNGILMAVNGSTDEQLFQLVASNVLAQEAAARDTVAVVAAPHRDATVSV